MRNRRLASSRNVQVQVRRKYIDIKEKGVSSGHGRQNLTNRLSVRNQDDKQIATMVGIFLNLFEKAGTLHSVDAQLHTAGQ